MNLSIRRTALRATATLLLGAALTGGAVVATAAVAPSTAGAATQPAPWEPVGNPPEAGGLLFFNATGTEVTSGNFTVAAFVEGTSTIRAGDTKAYLAAYTPTSTPPGKWSGEQLSLSTAYPNTDAPPPLNSSALPVVTTPTSVHTLATYIATFPNTATTPGYQDIYVLRLFTTAPSAPGNTSYDSADIRVTPTKETWSLVYPTTVTTVTTTPASPQSYGTSVTAHAAVTPATAAGSVQFQVDGKNVGTAVPVSDGAASSALSTLATGTHSIAAVFTPTTTAAFTKSTGSTPFTVTKAPTTATLTTTPAGTASYGTPVTLKATVSPAVAGTVQFGDNKKPLGTPVTVSGGKASYTTTSPLALGTHPLTAVFTPTTTANYAPSPAAAASLTVTTVVTTTTLTTTPSDSAAAGAPVKLTASVTPPTVGGTVQFEDGSSNIGSPVTVTGGSASTTTSTLSIGHHTLNAVFTPTAPTGVKGSTGSTQFAVTLVKTTTTLTTTPTSPVVQGTPVTLKATVSPSAAPGTVQFAVNSTDIGTPVAVVDGVATKVTDTLPVGTNALTADFTPTASSSYGGSTGTATFTVNPPTPTTTTLSVTPASPQVYGTSLTLKATVSPSATGTVQFEDGTTDIGSPIAVEGGTASTSTSTLGVGTHTLKAVFMPTPGNGYGGSTGTAPFTVTKAKSTTTLTTTPTSPVVYGTTVTLKATVVPSTLLGTVQFEDGSTPIGTPVTVSDGKASTMTSKLGVGTHTLSAIFTPKTSNYEASTGDLSFTVTEASTTTTLTTTPAGSQFLGASVKLEASVVPPVGGTVQFEDGSTPIGTPVTVSDGKASTTTSTLALGEHTLNAVFTPTTSNYEGSTGTVPFTVNPLTITTTMLTTTPASPQFEGTTVTLKASIAPSAATGTVQFEDGSTPIGTPVTVSGGSASIETSSLAVGTHTLKAVYTTSPSSGYVGSTGTASFVVEEVTTTTTHLAVSPSSPQQFGTSVALEATVTPSSAPGTVQFEDGSTSIGAPVPVAGGVASTATSGLAVGTHALNAVFIPIGGEGYVGSTGTASFTVTAIPTTTTVSATPPSPQSYGTSVTLTATVSPSAAPGTVQFEVGSTAIGGPVTVSGGSASVTTSSLPGGTDQLSATFTPAAGSGYASSTGTASYAVTGHSGNGYWLVASDGGIFAYGDASFYGSMGGKTLNKPIVGIATTPDGKGYWEVASDGGIFAFGDASFYGSMGGKTLNEPIVGIATTPDGKGYWEVASDGGIFAFGDASFYGSMGGKTLNEPIVGIATTPDGLGYWEVASDGGIFAFGDAAFYGSTGGSPINKPVVGIATTPDGKGYWEVASDGGIFAYGDASFYGSAGGNPINKPVVGIATTPDGKGYWEVASDGGIFSYGDASFYGSTGGTTLNEPVVGISAG